MKSSFFVAIALFVSIGGAAVASVPTVVDELLPPSSTPVVGTWYLSDVRPGGSASLVDLAGLGGDLENNQPFPTGAAKLTTDSTNEAKAEVATYADFGLASAVMNDVALGYSYYKQDVSGGNIWAAPSLRLILQTSGGTGDNYGVLVFEPYWNLPPGAFVPTNAWQNLSITSSTGAGSDAGGGWWWNGGFEIFPDPPAGPPLRSLGEWAAAFQAADPTDFANAHIISISVGVGTYNQGQIGYFDNVSIYSPAGSANDCFNFEVPEPGTLSLLFAGGLTALGAAMMRRRRAMK
jgi:hypothetical protein